MHSRIGFILGLFDLIVLCLGNMTSLICFPSLNIHYCLKAVVYFSESLHRSFLFSNRMSCHFFSLIPWGILLIELIIFPLLFSYINSYVNIRGFLRKTFKPLIRSLLLSNSLILDIYFQFFLHILHASILRRVNVNKGSHYSNLLSRASILDILILLPLSNLEFFKILNFFFYHLSYPYQ